MGANPILKQWSGCRLIPRQKLSGIPTPKILLGTPDKSSCDHSIRVFVSSGLSGLTTNPAPPVSFKLGWPSCRRSCWLRRLFPIAAAPDALFVCPALHKMGTQPSEDPGVPRPTESAPPKGCDSQHIQPARIHGILVTVLLMQAPAQFRPLVILPRPHKTTLTIE